MAEAFICDAVRTPFGRYGGALSRVRADDLAAVPLRALIERNPGVDWARVDDVVYGCANQAGEDNRNVGAHGAAARRAAAGGAGHDRQPAVRLEHGRRSRSPRARSRRGETALMIAGGVESMSRAPFVHGQGRRGVLARGEDRGHDDRLALRQSADEGAVRRRLDAGDRRERRRRNSASVAPTRTRSRCAASSALRPRSPTGAGARRSCRSTVAQKKGDPVVVAGDEHPRATYARGACEAEGDRARRRHGHRGQRVGRQRRRVRADPRIGRRRAALRPDAARARRRAAPSRASPPRIMGFGPAPAMRKVLAQAGPRRSTDMDVIELNEAFAAQALAVTRDHGLADDEPRVNPNGGAIALGHPLGASGARLVTTALYQLRRTRRPLRAVHDVHRRRAGHRAHHRARVNDIRSEQATRMTTADMTARAIRPHRSPAIARRIAARSPTISIRPMRRR